MRDIASEKPEKISSVPMEGVQTSTRFSFYDVIKRLLDIVTSLLGLIFLTPVFLLIAYRIKKDSPGPIFYYGERLGRHGKIFKMYKFRTMYETPANHTGAPITAQDDSRITPFGRRLRETKLNELPQLWNVLKGDMSFVGPRPEDPNIARNWPKTAWDEILSVRPGITSPASIIYRNEETLLKGAGFLDDYLLTILPDKLRLDQLYVRNLNLLTDLDVLAMTVIALLPAIRKRNIQERWIYGGAFYMLYERVISWFLVDILVTMFAVGLSGLVWRISTVINLGIPTFLVVSLAIALLISLINVIIGLSRVDWTKASPVLTIDLAFSTALTMVIIWAVNRFWLTRPWIPFSLIWLIGLTILFGLILVRYRDRLLTGLANRWLLFRGGSAALSEHVLVVGAGDLGELTIWLLNRSAYATVFGIVGIVDDDAHKQGMHLHGLEVIGETKDIPRLVKKYAVGLIFFAITNVTEEKKKQMLDLCESTGARTVVIPDLVKVLEHSISDMEHVQKNDR